MAIPQSSTAKRNIVSAVKQRSYQEIIAYLDSHWQVKAHDEAALARVQKLDRKLGTVSQQIPTIIVTGTNGKSLTAHFTAKLLQAEGLTVGTFYSPHILTYNERFSVNHETIQNKTFTDIGNIVLDAVESLEVEAHSQEILTLMSLIHFKKSNANVAILEARAGGIYDPVNICKAKIVGITRATPELATTTPEEIRSFIFECLGTVHTGTSVVSGDQVKANLQLMEELAAQRGGQWVMPIRKLAPLAYPFEQLHGRCAALAERIAHLFVNNNEAQEKTDKKNSLLRKEKGKRGRPTIAEKHDAQRNPRKNISQFWKETISDLPARFQILDKEKPSILLDNASNLDAFENILLGVRLLHYQKPLKGSNGKEGLGLIIGASGDTTLQGEEFLRAVRYFWKKTPGKVYLCPLNPNENPSNNEDGKWNVAEIAKGLKAHKVAVKTFDSFAAAFEDAKKDIDERYGLLVITGSNTVISEYWRHKGMKKLS
ncbi:MAG: hypothetical protein JW725_02875 [Candidatus Babeliaceae bacterium]|nr:hypothetical protein [Candidatus Babeliaceae bacterium]